MIASLPMYDWPETMKYNDLFWNNVRTALLPVCDNAPEKLSRTDLQTQWQRNDVLLSQTCVYPLVTVLPTSTVVVGTPLYNVDYCNEGNYASVLLVNKSDIRKTLNEYTQSTLAYNSKDSQSGYNALKNLLIEHRLINNEHPVFFSHSIPTGSHRNSLSAVASGSADICAIDPVSWALAQRFDSEVNQLRVLMPTGAAPALPLISSPAAIPATLNEDEWRAAVMNAFEQAIDESARKHLLLDGIKHVPKHEYLQLPISNIDMITD